MMESNASWNTLENNSSVKMKKIFSELYDYKDLIILFVKRDIKATYQQTILGPMWLILQPIVTSLVLVFLGSIAQIKTPAGLSSFGFYLLGNSLWIFFSDAFNKTASTFTANSSVFGKVYFPRLTVPVSVIISNSYKLMFQCLLFVVVYLYGIFILDIPCLININALFLLPCFLMLSLLGLSFGLIISSLTTKYRDLTMLVSFGLQLLMFASPVIYPLSQIPHDSKFYLLLELNPITGWIELAKKGFAPSSFFSWKLICYDVLFVLASLFVGIKVFHKVEKRFMDTV
ncbi:ABC transporter permease [Sphingobacteriaceae bacterium]|nr:ABC transporter permease [Sphingobacteriaceae bacterium]